MKRSLVDTLVDTLSFLLSVELQPQMNSKLILKELFQFSLSNLFEPRSSRQNS